MSGKILVVDDDQDILDIVSLVLEDEGYSVRILAKAEKTFDQIENFHPDLIILDVMLGDMDGRDICNAIKHTEKTLHIPIIMISGSHNIEDSLKQDCHPDDFMAKPFDINTLLSKVQNRLSA